jgi:predicted MFS family arabinose efflux permease
LLVILDDHHLGTEMPPGGHPPRQLAASFILLRGRSRSWAAIQPNERGKAQALNDFLIFSTTATSSFMAAYVQDHLGWYPLNWFAVAMMMAAAGAVIWLRTQHRALSPAY